MLHEQERRGVRYLHADVQSPSRRMEGLLLALILTEKSPMNVLRAY